MGVNEDGGGGRFREGPKNEDRLVDENWFGVIFASAFSRKGSD